MTEDAVLPVTVKKTTTKKNSRLNIVSESWKGCFVFFSAEGNVVLGRVTLL